MPKKSSAGSDILALLLIIGAVAAVIFFAVWLRNFLPCWVFDVASAPIKCLPGGSNGG